MIELTRTRSETTAGRYGEMEAALVIAAIEAKAHLVARVERDCHPKTYARWVGELNRVLVALGIEPIQEA